MYYNMPRLQCHSLPLSIAAFFKSGSRMPYYTIRNEISGISAADFVGGRFISVSQRTGYTVMEDSSCICPFKSTASDIRPDDQCPIRFPATQP